MAAEKQSFLASKQAQFILLSVGHAQRTLQDVAIDKMSYDPSDYSDSILAFVAVLVIRKQHCQRIKNRFFGKTSGFAQ